MVSMRMITPARQIDATGSPPRRASDPTSFFNQAVALHRTGRLAEAEEIYRELLKAQPDHFDSLHLLGVSSLQRGNYLEAVHQIDMALNINPNAAFAHNNRGNALKGLNRLDEVERIHDELRDLIEDQPARN
jgi:protein O-GlcNAc transferase